jgi:uroporphyrinogen-III decarboxylase
MLNNQAGLPGNWAELTPEQKRQWRQNNFINRDLKFISQQAKADYRIRAQRLVDAYNLKEPDRVPVNLPVADLPYRLYGITAYAAMYDFQKAVAACQEFNAKYAVELEYYATPLVIPAKALDILDYKLYAWPGNGLPSDAPGFQFLEGEYMKPEEYDDLIRDPSDYWLRTYMPRIFGTLASLRFFQPLTNIIEMPTGQIMALGNPQVKTTLRKILEASDVLEQRMQVFGPHAALGPASGFPSPNPGMCKAPFDILGDTLRGTAAIMKDMYRRPDKILAALDKITELFINALLESAKNPDLISVMFPLHKGADGWMSQKQFDTFYFPTLRKLIDALISEGLEVILFAEGSYNTRLDSVNVFPKSSVCWLFDQSDMVRAKKLLGDKCCIQGNVPSSLTVTGSPEDVKEYCRKLIEGCGKGGGYILSAGCTAENPKLDNLRAMLAAAKEYGVYRH